MTDKKPKRMIQDVALPRVPNKNEAITPTTVKNNTHEKVLSKVPETELPPIVEVEESMLEEASHAVNHPKPHRAQDFQEAPLKTIADHVGELRRRALYSAIALFVGGVIGYKFQDQIIAWLIKPLGKTLFYTSPAGGFDFLIKICIFFGFLLAIPVIMYNILRFISPAVPHYVVIKTGKLLVTSISLAILGASFAYYVSLPAALHFLNNFSSNQIQSLISAQEYFNFVMIYIAGFAALFQMPLIISFMNKVTPLKPFTMLKKQRVIILVSFVIAAVLTPTPDPINQTIMALPIIALYQISIILVWYELRKIRRKKNKAKYSLIAEPTGM